MHWGSDTINSMCAQIIVFYFGRIYKKNDVCPVCSASRWKDNDARKKIPEKVLRHFPLIPRLKRIFSSKRTVEEVQ